MLRECVAGSPNQIRHRANQRKEKGRMQRVSQERNSRVGEMEVELTFKKGVEGSNRSSRRAAKAVNRLYLLAVVQTIPFTSTLSEQVIVASLAVSCVFVCVAVWRAPSLCSCWCWSVVSFSNRFPLVLQMF